MTSAALTWHPWKLIYEFIQLKYEVRSWDSEDHWHDKIQSSLGGFHWEIMTSAPRSIVTCIDRGTNEWESLAKNDIKHLQVDSTVASTCVYLHWDIFIHIYTGIWNQNTKKSISAVSFPSHPSRSPKCHFYRYLKLFAPSDWGREPWTTPQATDGTAFITQHSYT